MFLRVPAMMRCRLLALAVAALGAAVLGAAADAAPNGTPAAPAMASGPADGSQPPRYLTAIVLCPALTVDDLDRRALPNLRAFAARGSIGLMNVAAPRRDLASAILTIAMGDHVAAEPGDGDVLRADDGRFDEGVPAAVAFARRTGLPIPAPDRLVHPGVAALARRSMLDPLLGARVPVGSAWTYVASRNTDSRQTAGLLLVGADGLGPRMLASPAGIASASPLPRSNLVVVCSDVRSADLALAAVDVWASAQVPTPHVIVCPLPSPDWTIGSRRLPAVVCVGNGWPDGVLTSPTTRTPGLVASIDVAPTILGLLGVRPAVGSPGHEWVSTVRARRLQEVRHLDRVVSTNEAALVPVFAGLGFLCAVVVFGGLWAVSRKGNARPYRLGALVLLTMPLAMMLAVPFGSETLPALAATIGALMLALGAGAWALTRKAPSARPPLIMGVTAIAILLDAVLGLRLVQFSMFSGYQLQGIRYYGIGNEYMGVLIGCALLAVCSWPSRRWAATALLACAWAVLGHPALGAKAGGIIVGAAAFGAGICVLRERAPGWRDVAAWTLAGIAAAFGVAWLDRVASGGTVSHIGSALASAEVQGSQHIVEIVLRKLAMNARIATNPIMFGSAALAALAMWVAAGRLDSDGGPWATDAARRNGFRAAASVAVVAFLFNDSGAVAAIFIVGPFIMAFLHDLFASNGPRGKEPGEPMANPQGT